MKQLWALCAALALFFSLTLLNGFYLAHFTQGLTDTLTQAEIMGEAGQWEQALTLTRQAHRKWQAAAGRRPAHSLLDPIGVVRGATLGTRF